MSPFTRSVLAAISIAVPLTGIQIATTQNAVHAATDVMRLLATVAHLQTESDDDDIAPPKSPPKDPKGSSPKSVQRPRGAEISVFANGTVGIVDRAGKTLLTPSKMMVGANGLISVNGRPWGVVDSAGTIVIGKKQADSAPHAAKLQQLRTAIASMAASKDSAGRPPSAGILGNDSGFGRQAPSATGKASKPAVIY